MECYRQGELAEVAKDPLKIPPVAVVPDCHLTLGDSSKRSAAEELRNNSGELIPLETAAQQLAQTQGFHEVEQKLEAAKEGNCRNRRTARQDRG